MRSNACARFARGASAAPSAAARSRQVSTTKPACCCAATAVEQLRTFRLRSVPRHFTVGSTSGREPAPHRVVSRRRDPVHPSTRRTMARCARDPAFQ
jgi:hypothetical protein